MLFLCSQLVFMTLDLFYTICFTIDVLAQVDIHTQAAGSARDSKQITIHSVAAGKGTEGAHLAAGYEKPSLKAAYAAQGMYQALCVYQHVLCVQATALNFIIGPGAYLKNGWSWIDFLTTLTG